MISPMPGLVPPSATEKKKFNNIDRRPDLDCGAASLDPLPFEDHEIDLDVFRLDVNSLQFKSTTLTTGKMVSVLWNFLSSSPILQLNEPSFGFQQLFMSPPLEWCTFKRFTWVCSCLGACSEHLFFITYECMGLYLTGFSSLVYCLWARLSLTPKK